MSFRTILPSEKLEEYIQSYWCLSTNDNDIAFEDHWLPNGSYEMIFCVGEPYFNISDHFVRKIPHSILMGMTTKAKIFKFPPNTNLVGIKFKPFGLYPFIKTNCSALTNQLVELNLILGDDEARLLNEFKSNPFESTISLLEKTLLKYLDQYRLNRLVTEAVSQISSHHGNISIETLCENLKTSKTNLAINFFNHVGVPPKTLANIYRLRHCVSLKIKKPTQSLTRIVYDCSYYDQSHFIKDFRRIAGMSPTKYFKKMKSLNEYFTEREFNELGFLTTSIAC